MAHYHIAIIRPEGYLHSEGFREVAEGLHATLSALGHAVVTAENSIDALATNIVLGAHLLTEEDAGQLLAGTIVYNLEQLGGATLPRWYMQLASRLPIWDYSRTNLEQWKAVPCVAPPKLVEIGFVPKLQRIEPSSEENIDVLFYGSINQRRRVVLQALESAGLRVLAVFGVYGQVRDALIRRAKVVLNVHAYETEIFEVVRVSYLLSNSKAVVAEASPDIGELADAVLVGAYEELVGLCVQLVADDAARRALAQRGATIFRSRPQIEILRAVLSQEPTEWTREGFKSTQLAPIPPGTSPAFPRKLNLGSGKDWREDCLNIDINDYWMPDAVLDLAQPQPTTIELTTERFGSIALEPGCFDEILANDVLEHIPNLTSAMGAALRLLASGGLFRIQVPYDLSWGGWQDPTHVRAFNERSWLYYTDWFWYLGWTDARFVVDGMEFALSPIGERLKSTCTGEDLIRTPRAVDSMRVTLKKVLLTEQEKHFVANYLKRPERRLVAKVPAPSAEMPMTGAESKPRKRDSRSVGFEIEDTGAVRTCDSKRKRVCILSANLGGIDSSKMSGHVPQNLPSTWTLDHYHYDCSNTTLRSKALHPRLQAKLYKMYGWELHPGYDYYIWLDAAFVISSKDAVEWLVNSSGPADIAMFRHPYRNSVKAEAEFCIDSMRKGDPYLTSRYAGEPFAEQVRHYYEEAGSNTSDGSDDPVLIAAGAFCYRPTRVVKEMLKDWYLECCRWSCQDQLSLPFVLRRHGIEPFLYKADLLDNRYLAYVLHTPEDAQGIDPRRLSENVISRQQGVHA